MSMSNAPALGAAIRPEWALDWRHLAVNHGSFGAAPKAVLAAQEEWRQRLEARPSYFMRCILPVALRESADAVAAFVGAAGQDVALIDNATTGCNAVLHSLAFAPGDEILLFSHAYGAVRNTAIYVAERSGARIVEAAVPFPGTEADALLASFAGAITARTRLAVIDHITSPSALLLPVERLVRSAQAHAVPVLVDGAHGPGQVALDLTALGADWYVGNCHKWMMAPKGCGFLWARADRQQGLHPTTISHGFGGGFLAEFDWTGTRDPSACLAVPAAIDFLRRLGGSALLVRNAALARQAGLLLADRLGTEIGAPAALGAAMALVRLPLGGAATTERAKALRLRLLEEFATDAPLHALAGAIWVRLSAQAYNELEDYEKLAEICRKLCRDQ
jgi:isopenicillin-N epimerase